MTYRENAEFSRELKRLSKKWRTLKSDLRDAKRAIDKLYQPHDGVRIDDYRDQFLSGKNATVLRKTDAVEVIKMRLDCASPGAKGKLHLIFVYRYQNDEVLMIELYTKNEKNREDTARITQVLD